MAKVEIYTSPWCPFCVRAKKLLDSKKVSYEEIDVSKDAALKQAMIERASGRHTVPQIFINDKGYGGCDDIVALDKKGELDALLA